MEGHHLQACKGSEVVDRKEKASELVIVIERFKYNGIDGMNVEGCVEKTAHRPSLSIGLRRPLLNTMQVSCSNR